MLFQCGLEFFLFFMLKSIQNFQTKFHFRITEAELPMCQIKTNQKEPYRASSKRFVPLHTMDCYMSMSKVWFITQFLNVCKPSHISQAASFCGVSEETIISLFSFQCQKFGVLHFINQIEVRKRR